MAHPTKEGIFHHGLAPGESKIEPIHGNVEISIEEVCQAELGFSGRLLSHSKTMYRRAGGDHLVWYNACVRIADPDEQSALPTEIWFGDIDVTEEEPKLQRVAERLGRRILVTSESPYRWEGPPEDFKDLDPRTARLYAPEGFKLSPISKLRRG